MHGFTPYNNAGNVILCVVEAEGDGPADSDEEFAEDFQPNADDKAVDQDDTLQDEEFSASEPPSPELPVEVKFLEGIISSAVTQGLSSITNSAERPENNEDDTPAGKHNILVI